MLRAVTMIPLSTSIDLMLEHAGEARHAARVAAMRARFEERTGTYTPDDPWFEARSAAFWDDALTAQRFGDELALLDDRARFWLEPLSRAHRGLFRVTAERNAFVLDDAWSGARFRVNAAHGLKDALARANGFVDGRVVAAVVGATVEVSLLAGALFHADDATAPIAALLPIARERALGRDALLDALMRMELAFRSHSRVKAAYAYRKEALPRS
jgi:hypothetical protein